MPQAVVDPDDLRQFALMLRKFNVELRDRLSALTTHMQSLSETWRDQEHKRFADQFDEHLKLMVRFLELSERHVPYLIRKADQVLVINDHRIIERGAHEQLLAQGGFYHDLYLSQYRRAELLAAGA